MCDFCHSCHSVAIDLCHSCHSVTIDLCHSCHSVAIDLCHSCHSVAIDLCHPCHSVAIDLCRSCHSVSIDLCRSCHSVAIDLCHSCHSVAIDKAMAYINTGELPWDMDLPTDARIRQKLAEEAISMQEESDGSESSTETPDEEEDDEDAGDADGDSDSEGDQSESSDGEEVDIATDKKRFMENLRRLHQKRGTPIIRHPVLGQKDVDLYLLHQYVRDYGGMEKVCAREGCKLTLECKQIQTATNVHIHRYSFCGTYVRNSI